MPDQYYDSTLTGKQLDAAFLQMQNIQQTATQVQSNATAAAQSASQAASSASAASGSASQASTYAGQASEHASAASDSADAASESARQAAASAASIEGDVEQASSSASAAAQSATQASGSASAAAQSASAAADSEDSVQQNAAAAQQAAAAASQSKSDAEVAASNAASSASTAQQAASLIEENLSAIQAAPSNAQAAQQAAAQAAASASAAEDAAERAEQIADFNPADFATSAQGTKADTAVQSVNGKTGTAITLGAADVGAATAAQGSLAETAVQPDALDAYALKTDVPDTPADIGAATAAQGAKADTAVQSVNGAKPDSSGNVQLDLTTGTVRSVNGKDPDGSGNVQLSAGDVGAATAAQGAKADTALQPGALNGYAQTSDIPSKLPNPQALGIQLGSGGSVTSYDGSVSRTVAITPEAIGAQPAGAAAGGGKMTLIRDTGWDSCNIGQTISLPDLSGYDAIGIQVVPDVQKSATNRSQMNIFPIPASGISECMLCASEIDSGTNFAELVARRLTIYGTTLTISTLGYFLNLPGGPPSAQLCVPRTIYGIKF